MSQSIVPSLSTSVADAVLHHIVVRNTVMHSHPTIVKYMYIYLFCFPIVSLLSLYAWSILSRKHMAFKFCCSMNWMCFLSYRKSDKKKAKELLAQEQAVVDSELYEARYDALTDTKNDFRCLNNYNNVPLVNLKTLAKVNASLPHPCLQQVIFVEQWKFS